MPLAALRQDGGQQDTLTASKTLQGQFLPWTGSSQHPDVLQADL